MELPAYFFHVTPRARLSSILREGLRPRPSRYEGRLSSRPGFIYLANDFHSVREFYMDQLDKGEDPVIIKLNRRALEPSYLAADEDWFDFHEENLINHQGEPAGWGGIGVISSWRYYKLEKPPAYRDDETLAEWASRQNLWRPELVGYALKRGSVAYQRSVAPEYLFEPSLMDYARLHQRCCGYYGYPKEKLINSWRSSERYVGAKVISLPPELTTSSEPELAPAL